MLTLSTKLSFEFLVHCTWNETGLDTVYVVYYFICCADSRVRTSNHETGIESVVLQL